MTTLENTTTTKQIITQVINAWESQNKTVTAFFNKYSADDYMGEVAPGRNRAIYLLGHLVSANDGLHTMFGLGERLFPHYESIFSTSPDKTVKDIPSLEELKKNWEAVNTDLDKRFRAMLPTEWLERHTKVSEEDFAKEPLRNKLNVLLCRTNHLSYHMGQLTFLPSKN